MSAWRAIVTKELRELLRDRLSLTLALVLPVILLMLFAYGLNLDVARIRLGVYDLDGSSISREYLASLSASGDLTIAFRAASTADLAGWLDRGDIHLGVIVPPDFQRRLVAGEAAMVQVLADGSFPTHVKGAIAQFDAATEFFNLRLASESRQPVASGAVVVAEPRIWFNPELKSINYIVAGLYSLIPMTFAPLLSALAIVRERERGSMQHLLIAPVSPAALILGKAAPYGLLAFLDMVLVLILGLFWFKAPFRGSFPLFLGASLIYVLCTVGVGLLISTWLRSQVVAMVLTFVVTLMPSFHFSGFFTPLYSLPEEYQIVSYGFPARYFTAISHGIALKGLGFDRLWPDFAALTFITVLLLALAMLRFRRRLV